MDVALILGARIFSFVLPGIWVPETNWHTQVQFLTGADCVISYLISF